MTRLRFLLRAAAVSLGIAPAVVQAQTSSCRPADSTSIKMLAWVTNVVTGTDSGSVRQRAQMKLPQVAASKVTYVTDNRLCSKVVTPYNAETVMQDATGSVPPSGQLYVIKVGTVYLASDPAKSAGAFRVYVTLDNKYRVLAASLG